jgi:hypothetical protein
MLACMFLFMYTLITFSLILWVFIVYKVAIFIQTNELSGGNNWQTIISNVLSFLNSDTKSNNVSEEDYDFMKILQNK